jgi:hypothetical protein
MRAFRGLKPRKLVSATPLATLRAQDFGETLKSVVVVCDRLAVRVKGDVLGPGIMIPCAEFRICAKSVSRAPRCSKGNIHPVCRSVISR